MLSGAPAAIAAGAVGSRAMTLPLTAPIEPQLARSAKELPVGEQWSYEPKFDGFRALAFVDGDDVMLQSRGQSRWVAYFPELSFPAGRYVLDGEIVIDGRRRPAGLRRPAAAHPSRGVADRACSPSRPRRATSPSTCWRSTTRRCSSCPSPSAARALEALAAERPRPPR